MTNGEEADPKTTVPEVHHKILPRNKIAKIIDGASLDKVVCVVAPYGCGKTLAIISWLRERGRQAAWLSLEQRDDAEDVFLAGLTSALTAYVEEDRPRPDGLQTDAQDEKDALALLLETASRPARDGCEKTLVVDNCGYILDVKIHRLMMEFVSACLGAWKVILISRSEPPPAFNELIMKGRVCLVTLKDLNFSSEEIEDYFLINGSVLPPRDILRMRADTEGWPAALNVILTVSGGGPVDYGDAARDYVKIFFETEVWGGLDETIRDFLLKTSVLDVLTSSSCQSVTDIGATRPILNWLFQNGIFIEKLEERDTYRYHGMFRDYLLEKLEASGLDEKLIYKKYAWWLYGRREIERAFSYFFKARDWYGVRQALKLLNMTTMGIEGYLERVGCLMSLDPSELKSYPEIAAGIALMHYLTGDIARMQSICRMLMEWAEPGTLPLSSEEYAEYIWEIGWLRYVDPDELTWDPNDLKGGQKEHLEHSNYSHYVPHLQELSTSRYAAQSFPSMFRGIRDYGNDGLINIEYFLERSEWSGDRFMDEEYSLWTTYLILAEYEYEREHFAKAESVVQKIKPLVEDRRYTYLYFTCIHLLVNLARAAYDPGEIDDLIARLEDRIMSSGNHFMLPNFHAFEMRNRLAGGQTGFTDVFLKENSKYADKPYIFLLYRHITYVRGLLSVGNYSEAIIILGNLELTCRKYNRPTDLIEVNILRSIAFFRLKYESDARRCLIEALTAAKRYGFIRLFADEAKDIWPILELVRKQMNDKYMQNVIASCRRMLARSGHKIPAQKPQNAGLTKTELKILKSLRADMSYEEIALDNGIRISTVKSHAHSVYSKLEVTNRTAAVMVALRMGLIQ